MKRRQFGLGLLAGGLGVACSLVTRESEARPGGGQTFRKSSSSDSGSSFGSSSSPSSYGSDDGDRARDREYEEERRREREKEREEERTKEREKREEEERKRKERDERDKERRRENEADWARIRANSNSSPNPRPSSPATYSPSPVVSPKRSSWSDDPIETGIKAVAAYFGIGTVGIVIFETRSALKGKETWTGSGTKSHSQAFTPAPTGPRPPPIRNPPPVELLGRPDVPNPAKITDATIQQEMDSISARDPYFSQIVFEDFLYGLYAETLIASGKHALAPLEPYLGPTTQAHAKPSGVREIRNVVVGSMKITKVNAWRHAEAWIQIKVVFEGNYTEVWANGSETSYAVVDEWSLERDPDKPSRKPERAFVLDCPHCGASLDKNIAAKCGYCGEVCSPGKFDWTVTAVQRLESETRAPMLTGTTEEVGTDLPTRAAPDAGKQFALLMKKDPAFGWAAFQARVTAIFHAFYQGWNLRDLTGVRPYLSDNLMTTQRYWIETYKAQGLRNVCENPRVAGIHIARIRSDKLLNAITVRVYASCIDYTVDQAGNVVGGNRTKERQYSEYWTLIRAVGRQGTPREDPVCPNCGAPNIHINMAGKCGHCQAHVTSGEFDWVLSRIEQDEVYEG